MRLLLIAMLAASLGQPLSAQTDATEPDDGDTGDAAAIDCGLYEAVEPGDTFRTIARRCGVAFATLRELNPGIKAAEPTPGIVLSLDASAPAIENRDTPPAAAAAEGNAGPAQRYKRQMTGLWHLAKWKCAKKRGTVELKAEEVRFRDEGTCKIGDISDADGLVSLDLSCPRADGKTQTLQLELTDDGALRIAGRDIDRPLERCEQ